MKPFSEDDLRKIREAVQAAERRTRGEIVPMIVLASGIYRDARHIAGLLTAVVMLIIVMSVEMGWGGSVADTQYWGLSVLAAVVGYAVGSYAGSTPTGIRLFTSKARMAMKVRHRAERAFYEHGLHKTKEGTGILIMVSLLERQVQVLADRAINELVPEGTWQGVVQTIIRGIKEDRAVEGLCRAIMDCGELLARHFPVAGGPNPDELPDDLIQER
jgi:putative membrane protein